ncbi:hydrolase [Palaeococcus sp. (in: euryarchaeotes)]
MRRRGFIFTFDAMLSLLLITIFVSSIVVMSSNNQVYSTYIRNQNKYVAEDTLTTLRTASLKDLVPQNVIEEWENNGTLDLELVNEGMSPLDIVSTYWATEPLYPSKNLRHKAEIILGYLLNRTLKDYNYELLINNYTSPYLRKVGGNYSQAPDVSPATLVLSGYAYNQTPRGYMARAYLTKLGSKENTYTIRGGYIYARTDNSNQEVIIKYIVPPGDIPSDAQIEEIDWFLEPAWVGSQYEVYLNGQLIWSGYVDNNHPLTDSDPSGGLQLIENFLPGQQNVFEVHVYRSGYDGGEDGAQYIKIRYRTSVPSTLKFPRRFYFEDVTATYPINVWKFLIIPGLLRSLNIQVSVGNVSSTEPITLRFVFDTEVSVSPTSCSYDNAHQIKTCYWSNTTISNTLSSNGYSYTQISGKWTTIKVSAGGNWYHNPRIHLIKENSFIEADYAVGVLLTPYSIDITEPITAYTASNCDASGFPGFCRNIEWTFNVPSGAIPLWVKFQSPWLHSVERNPSQRLRIDNPLISPTYLYCHNGDGYSGCSPSNPFTHFAQFGYATYSFDYAYNPLPNAIATGTNTIGVYLGPGYWLQPQNGHGELTYVIQAYAGYGDVFPKLIRPGCNGYNITYYWIGDANPHYITAGESPYCDVTAGDLLANKTTYAVDDAIIRLFNNLGGNGTSSEPLLIELPANVNIDFASMGNIPGLFEPIQITLRVWRES